MSNDEQINRRSTKLPLGSKTIHLDFDLSQSQSNPTDISETSCLSALKSKLQQIDFSNITKESIITDLQSHLSTLKFFRNYISKEFDKIQQSQTLSIPHRVSETEIVSYDTPFKNSYGPTSNSTIIQSSLGLSRQNSTNATLPVNLLPSHPSLVPSISHSSLARQRCLSVNPNQLYPGSETAFMDSSLFAHHGSNASLQPASTTHSTLNFGRSNSQSHQKRTDSSNGSSGSSKSMSALTIWNNVNRFFLVTPTVDTFQSKLQPSQPPDTNLPLGPHYSIGINQKLKQKYKNGTVQLRVPPEMAFEMPEGVMSIIFHRLLSAFVPIYNEDEEQSEVQTSENASNENQAEPEQQQNVEEEEHDTQNDSNSLSYADLAVDMKDEGENSFDPFSFNGYSDLEQFPVNVAGTSMYSMYSFEQKLMLEIQSLGLVPESSSGPKMTDNEVMDELLQINKELNEVITEGNKNKREMLENLRNNEKGLIERKEMAKKWGSVSFKPEQGQKKDQKRPKKRDKLI